jgi:hypothetical protein
VLLSKPERIAAFDAELIDRLRAFIGAGSAALVEVAGRDSIAAGLASARSGAYETLVPTIVYTGTEFGDWEVVLENARSLRGRLGDVDTVQVAEETVVLGSPRWWQASAGRYGGALFNRYGFSPTCIACHMYLHAARVPFALEIGARAVISGERLRHDGRVKLNQLGAVLDAYGSVLEAEGLVLDLPLRKAGDSAVIEDLVGQWPESRRQMSCVLESNYRGADGSVTYHEEAVASYLQEFLVPFTKQVLEGFRRGAAPPPDYAGIASSLLAERRID